MRVAQVIGKVVLARCHPAFDGATLKVARAMSLKDAKSAKTPKTEDLVVYDELGAGNGDRILLSEGGEAAQPFRPELKPVDAYNAGIIDSISFE